MKGLPFLLSVLLSACAAAPRKDREVASLKTETPCQARAKLVLAIHGGVGYVASEAQARALADVLQGGHARLAQGARALDVVQWANEQMEDSGIFNAGKGGTRTNQGTVELDASIMDGRDLDAGAVASLKDVKNPIRLARMVKDRTPHVFMVGPGASAKAREFKLETVTPDYFTASAEKKSESSPGTVGAVALDRCGDLAAGTSTGGLFGKAPGRVGDSPVIGAGTYANNKTAAISATGEGEKFIRANVAGRISNILEYTRENLSFAVRESLNQVEAIKGSGGLISVDRQGEVVIATTQKEPMPSGFVREDGKLVLQDAALK
jgi:beta-aspartyl-peptidase (threonine type)